MEIADTVSIAGHQRHGDGRINARVINTVFNEVCSLICDMRGDLD